MNAAVTTRTSVRAASVKASATITPTLNNLEKATKVRCAALLNIAGRFANPTEANSHSEFLDIGLSAICSKYMELNDSPEF